MNGARLVVVGWSCVLAATASAHDRPVANDRPLDKRLSCSTIMANDVKRFDGDPLQTGPCERDETMRGAARLSAVDVADLAPGASTANEDGRAKRRRVELVPQ